MAHQPWQILSEVFRALDVVRLELLCQVEYITARRSNTMPMTRIKRRHPEDGGYARGEETRARIIDTALRVFGEAGFNEASTRQIAADGGVNPPALQYYFGGKEGLHRACAQFIIDRMMVIVSPALTRAREIGGSAQRS